MSFKLFSLLTTVFLVAPLLSAETLPPPAEVFQNLDQELTTRRTDGVITGGQVAVRQNGKLLFSRSYGVVAVQSERAVDEKTLFLIGSCSKPFVSICILSLIADQQVSLRLDDQIDRWLPALAMAKVDGDGTARRAPTVEELLAHRSGIYSQKVGMTKEQAHWIRTFQHSLAEGVDGITTYDLIAQPGDMFAYSGAGYCVLGRVAELATGKSFEAVLQQRLCCRIGLRRTTFFPGGKFADQEIATGIDRDDAPHRLGKDHRFPLIGGSLYSTAEEMTWFGQQVASQFNGSANCLCIEPQLMQELGRIRSRETGYSLGWKVSEREGKAPRISHSGALQSYRAWLGVDLETGVTVAGCWTVAAPTQKQPIPQMLQRVLESL